MIEQLPPSISDQLRDQLNVILNQYHILIKTITPHLHDLELQLNYMQFDLEATKRERDALKEHKAD